MVQEEEEDGRVRMTKEKKEGVRLMQEDGKLARRVKDEWKKRVKMVQEKRKIE